MKHQKVVLFFTVILPLENATSFVHTTTVYTVHNIFVTVFIMFFSHTCSSFIWIVFFIVITFVYKIHIYFLDDILEKLKLNLLFSLRYIYAHTLIWKFWLQEIWFAYFFTRFTHGKKSPNIFSRQNFKVQNSYFYVIWYKIW